MVMAIWLNGVPVDAVSAADRGFAYGDGHFTTLPVRGGVAVLADYHWLRLRQASAALGISPEPFPRWEDDFCRFIAAYPDITAKIVITRGRGGRGYLPDEEAQPCCYFLAWPVSTPEPGHQTGIDSGVLQGRLGLNPMTAGHKHLNRLEQVLLRRELAGTSWSEGVVLDLNGEVVEGVFSNLFLVRDRRVYTPPLTSAGVAGVMRAFLIDYLQGIDRPVLISPLRLEHLTGADELFFCNSLFGIWPVRRFNGTMLPPNPVTQHLLQHLKNVRITA